MKSKQKTLERLVHGVFLLMGLVTVGFVLLIGAMIFFRNQSGSYKIPESANRNQNAA